jgi:hypothetical protein
MTPLQQELGLEEYERLASAWRRLRPQDLVFVEWRDAITTEDGDHDPI